MKPIVLKTGDTPVVQKTKELCEVILAQPAYQAMRSTIEEFMGHAELRGHYQRLCDLQDELSRKQEGGELITEAEVHDFERTETLFLENPIAQSFIEVQRQMHTIEETVSGYVRKTFELGRVPTEDDLDHGCGPGCGCH
jgi:cell fate (sporulation/competence/biofilm development) regulator YlbF (YheA/YmcA/DUF963 family)